MTKVFYEKRSYRSINCNSNGILYAVVCEYNNFFCYCFRSHTFFHEVFFLSSLAVSVLDGTKGKSR